MNRLNVLVLAGGPSAEREVSFMSGQNVAAALVRGGHTVTFSDVGPNNLAALDTPGIDVVFPVLHGTWGEDGQLQAILERRGLAYVGSGPKASALAMDKAASKTAFQAAGLPTPAWQVLGEWSAAAAGAAPVGLPAVVKPVDQGSSVDLTIARDAAKLRRAVRTVCSRWGRCMVERFVGGRELTVGVLGRSALPPIEIVVHGHEFYDYQAKYFDDATEYRVEPKLPAGVRDTLSRLALAAHRALGCRDFSRVDFILPRLRQAGGPTILEVNTIPGFTSHSLLPKAAARAGLDFVSLCRRLVELAMARKTRDARNKRAC